MAYKTITVDGVDYNYVLGKTHLKVRGLDAATLQEVGKIRSYPEYCCEYRCMVVREHQRLSAQPADIVQWIRSKIS